MNVALHAPDAVPVDRGALARGPRIALHPSVTLLRSPWPVDAIWRANQPEVVDDRVEVDGGGVDIQVWRAGDDVLFRALSPAAFVLRAAVGYTGSLKAAEAEALALDTGIDLAAHIVELLDEEVVVARS